MVPSSELGGYRKARVGATSGTRHPRNKLLLKLKGNRENKNNLNERLYLKPEFIYKRNAS